MSALLALSMFQSEFKKAMMIEFPVQILEFSFENDGKSAFLKDLPSNSNNSYMSLFISSALSSFEVLS